MAYFFFRGGVEEKLMGSLGRMDDAGNVTFGNIVSGEPFPSMARRHGPGEALAVMGEGSGVMSTNGPTPGEEKAEEGESEPARWRPADRTERTLPLRPNVLEVASADSATWGLVVER